jgi:hypothetical protein
MQCLYLHLCPAQASHWSKVGFVAVTDRTGLASVYVNQFSCIQINNAQVYIYLFIYWTWDSASGMRRACIGQGSLRQWPGYYRGIGRFSGSAQGYWDKTVNLKPEDYTFFYGKGMKIIIFLYHTSRSVCGVTVIAIKCSLPVVITDIYDIKHKEFTLKNVHARC